MANIDLDQGENKLGKWTLNYLPPQGGRYNGVLTVTDKRLIFEARFDTSFTKSAEIVSLIQSDSGHFLIIPKTSIKDVEISKSFFSKKVLITLENTETHVFHYGMLSVKTLAEAIKKMPT